MSDWLNLLPALKDTVLPYSPAAPAKLQRNRKPPHFLWTPTHWTHFCEAFLSVTFSFAFGMTLNCSRLKLCSSVNMQMQSSSPLAHFSFFPDAAFSLVGEQLLSIGQWNSSLWQKEKKKACGSFLYAPRSFYTSGRASPHNCSQLVEICQSYYLHQWDKCYSLQLSCTLLGLCVLAMYVYRQFVKWHVNCPGGKELNTLITLRLIVQAKT